MTDALSAPPVSEEFFGFDKAAAFVSGETAGKAVFLKQSVVYDGQLFEKDEFAFRADKDGAVSAHSLGDFGANFSRLLKNGETVPMYEDIDVQLQKALAAKDVSHIADIALFTGDSVAALVEKSVNEAYASLSPETRAMIEKAGKQAQEFLESAPERLQKFVDDARPHVEQAIATARPHVEKAINDGVAGAKELAGQVMNSEAVREGKKRVTAFFKGFGHGSDQ